jgi:signal transduction histidine kinase
VLHEVLNLQEISADMKQVSINLKRLEDPHIDIDADRLQQVTLNLVSNALKFSKKGGMVEVSSHIYTENSKKFVKVFVKDNGFGIKEEDKPKLFNHFGKIK